MICVNIRPAFWYRNLRAKIVYLAAALHEAVKFSREFFSKTIYKSKSDTELTQSRLLHIGQVERVLSISSWSSRAPLAYKKCLHRKYTKYSERPYQ
jgi:hypothetical protein